MNKILKIAHRGASGYEPENTLAAFKKAIEMGADGVELDVHLSKDSEIIVIHDETIDRTTNGFGAVNELNLSELKQFKMDGKHEIPTLNEVLDLINHNFLVNIELKSTKNVEKATGLIEKVIILIKKMILENDWNYNNFIISSFDWTALEKVKKLDKNIPIGILTYTDLDLAIVFATKIKAYSIHPYYQLLNKQNIQKMQENKLKIFTWTVNKTVDIRKIKSYKVDGIISDFIDRI